ncbi:MAG: hypothetical protein LBP64_06285 [Tannerella sp.]|jgi:hypothetical protein|nr:hypothetical protein [Tannerella sp.]
MNTKRFPCKIKEVPVIGALIVSFFERDMKDFKKHSPVFNSGYPAIITAKISACHAQIASFATTRELKVTTWQLHEKAMHLRSKLNSLEGCLKLSARNTDADVNEIGLKQVRREIYRHNVKGVVSKLKPALITIKHNQPLLEAAGLKTSLIDEIESLLREIISLHEKQNRLTLRCSKSTKIDIERFNDLWDSLQPVLTAAKTIYRGVDKAKMKDYNVSQLKQRINKSAKPA